MPPWDCSQVSLTKAWELGGGADQEMNLLAPMPGGDMIVVGDFWGEVDFGDGVVVEAPQGDDVVVARIRPDGVALWATVIVADQVHALATDDTGRIAVAGSFSQFLVFAPGTSDSVQIPSEEISSGYVAMLNPDGSLLWARTMQGVGLESADVLAVAADGTAWASGVFSASSVTISYAEADAAVITGGDANPSDDDAWLAHYGPNGELLGVASVLGDGDQEVLALSARPAGGVDLMAQENGGGGATVTDMAGAPGALSGGTSSFLRLDPSGALEDLLVFDVSSLFGTGYFLSDLVATAHLAVPTTLSPWDESAPTELAASKTGQVRGVVRWVGGIGPVVVEAVGTGTLQSMFASPLGLAVAGRSGGDMLLLPDTEKIELEDSQYSDGSGRSFALAWDPTGAYICAVDIEVTGEEGVGAAAQAVALDEAGGLWLAGKMLDETFLYEQYQGGPIAASFEATAAEAEQGFLARWQLWPPSASTAPSTPP